MQRTTTLSIIQYCLLISFIMFAAQARTADIDDIHFPDNGWDGQALNLLINGPGYLDASLEFDLPIPPSNSSQQTTEELEYLHKLQAEARTPEQLEKTLMEAQGGDFAEVFLSGGPFSPEMKQTCAHILSFANKQILYFIMRDKKRFSRPRPSQLSPDLKLVVANPGHASYPSGHATQAMIMAEILSMIDPGRASSYEDYAFAIAQRREIAGIHYPSDSKAGQYMAGKLLVELMKVEEFRQLLMTTQHDYMTLLRTKH